MDQYRVSFPVVQNLKRVGDVLERDGDRLVFVCWDGYLKVLDAIFLHKEDVFGRILLRDEREDGFQAQGTEVLEIAVHGEAAPVDAWSDLTKVEDRA